MDYIREFDIRLEKEMYYAGELLSGVVILDTIENFKLRAIRVVLRGKAHTEWKVIISGDRRTVKDDQYFIDDRSVIWGKEKAEGAVPILPRGMHQFPFRFQLPETSLPCSFESKCGTIRYYLKVTIDIPYASPPQGVKYFTIIGPHIDCMDDSYLKPIRGECKRKTCCLCCERRVVSLRTQLDRSAYCCGESLRVKADIDNQSEEEARLRLKLVQHVEYFIDRGVLGVQKEVSHTILEYRSAPVSPHTRTKWDSQQSLVVSTMPPTLAGICRLIQIYYVLKVNLEFEKSGEDLLMHFPITVGTVPFRIPNSKQKPKIQYEVASDHVEGGMYIGPEFQLGQVYDGTTEFGDSIVLYRPVYINIVPSTATSANSSGAPPPAPTSSSSSSRIKSLKNSILKPSSTASTSQAQANSSKASDGTETELTSKSSAKSKSSKVQKMHALALPSLQSIAKKRSSLPDNTKTHPFNFTNTKPPIIKPEPSCSTTHPDEKSSQQASTKLKSKGERDQSPPDSKAITSCETVIIVEPKPSTTTSRKKEVDLDGNNKEASDEDDNKPVEKADKSDEKE
ncbi:Arrestin domain-containing protein 2 [Orchesella cincta]|uniref:Arrestin domain-containing protein 2 n=1 Tax=Orchesella cincta TaxID=48709 RepID=A0A1D2M9L0_ORCCI|nr:Arrestin domain-containing protein 2 [Orchesella cincta]